MPPPPRSAWRALTQAAVVVALAGGVPDTYCMESLSAKFTRCLDCPFFQQVEREQASAFTVMGKIVERLSSR